MKKLLNLNGAQLLSKDEQKAIQGGKVGIPCPAQGSPGCQAIFVSANCCHPCWTSCGFSGANHCVNGQCIL